MLCKKGFHFWRVWEPLGLPVATFSAILGQFSSPKCFENRIKNPSDFWAKFGMILTQNSSQKFAGPLAHGVLDLVFATLWCFRRFDHATLRSCGRYRVVWSNWCGRPGGAGRGKRAPCRPLEVPGQVRRSRVKPPKHMPKSINFFNRFFITKCIQNESKINPRIHQKIIKTTIIFCIEFGYHFECILESFSTSPTLDFWALAYTRCNFSHFRDFAKTTKNIKKIIKKNIQNPVKNL